jgi:hypothetical protein
MIMAGFKSNPLEAKPSWDAEKVVVPLPFHGSKITDSLDKLALSNSGRAKLSGYPA